MSELDITVSEHPHDTPELIVSSNQVEDADQTPDSSDVEPLVDAPSAVQETVVPLLAHVQSLELQQSSPEQSSTSTPEPLPGDGGEPASQTLSESSDTDGSSDTSVQGHDAGQATLEQLTEGINQLERELTALDDHFVKRLAYDDTKEKVIDRQHSELTELREGLARNLLRPVLYDIAEALDDIRKTKNTLIKRGEDEGTLRVLDDVENSLLYILEKNDVERIESETGSDFSAVRQRMVKTEDSSDRADSRKVARSVAPGYVYGKETLFKEKVVVYKIVDAAPQSTTSSEAVAPSPDVTASAQTADQ